MKHVITKLDGSGEKASVFIKNGETEAKVMSVDLTEVNEIEPFAVQMKLGVVVYNALMTQKENEVCADGVLEDIEKADQLILDMAKGGDSSAQHAMAMTCIHKSIKEKDVDLLGEAEGWLKKSSESGYARAKNFLENTWPELKVDYKDRILGSGSS